MVIINKMFEILLERKKLDFKINQKFIYRILSGNGFSFRTKAYIELI